MALTAEATRVDIPHESGAWMELRPLSWKELKEARKVQSKENRDEAKDFGVEFVAALTKGQVDEAKARKLIREQEYEPGQFDTATMLELGIAAWSYDNELNSKSIEQLDERTAVWAKQQIIDLTKPPSEEAQKNS